MFEAAHLAEANNRLCILAHVLGQAAASRCDTKCTHLSGCMNPPQDQMMFTDKILKKPVRIRDGEVMIPQGQGWIELDDEKIAKYQVKEAQLSDSRNCGGRAD